MTGRGNITVLIVDDSRAVRLAFERLLAVETGIDVVGLAADPYEAVEFMRQITPDVIILDIVMPKMDGLTFLSKIMEQHPLPVIVCSSQVGPDSGQAVLALERGAVDVIPKPRVGIEDHLEESREQIVRAIRAASRARLQRRPSKALLELREVKAADTKPGRLRDAATSGAAGSRSFASKPAPRDRIVVIGASTGGTEALATILRALPSDAPGIVIAQHMPPGFTAAFARRLDQICEIAVSEAAGEERILPGTAFIAPGDAHALVRGGAAPRVVLSHDAPVNRHRPSCDVLFRSAAREFGPRALGILLTGMGNDGAGGLGELFQTGAETIAQDEATSVVWGMPASAVKLGAAGRVLPLDRIADAIVAWGSQSSEVTARG